MLRAPFPPLIADGEDLSALPARPEALITRMAAIYGVDPSNVLPTQGPAQALALIARHVALIGKPSIASAPRADLARIAQVNRVALVDRPENAGALILASPDLEGAALTPNDIAAHAKVCGDTLLLLDESLIEFTDAPSAAALVDKVHNLVVLRDLSFAYGLAGAPCAALLAAPQTIASLLAAEEPGGLPAPIVKLATTVLEPQRLAANAQRLASVRAARARLARALPHATEAGGPFVWLAPKDQDAARTLIQRFALEGEWRGDRFLLALSTPEANERALAAFGVEAARQARAATVVRDTAETRIVASVNLDSEGVCDVSTGIGFYDHMLSQIATHGGFSLTLCCAGDLEVDGHHTIEDCALALGQALKQALGDKRGIARFGFMLPMDEAEARVSVDLSGRPFLVFEGAYMASHIGAYPTEMTEHVFRSLAQSMGASIHLHVTGENDHHKTEACYKAFGRALRQAIRIEGQALPSTKGAL